MKQLSLMSFLIILLITNIMAQSKGGHWQFENNGFDNAEWDVSDDNGALIGSASYNQQVPLQEGASYLWLNTIYDYNFFKVEDSDDLDFTDENIGLSAWIYPILFNDTHFFINKGVQNTNPKTTNYSLRVSKSYTLEFLIRDAMNQARKVESHFTIPLNQWTFVAVFYDFAAHKVYMWNDPFTDAADTLDFDQSFFANDGPLGIGAWYVNNEAGPSAFNFKGRIDDVRISGRLEDIFPQVTAIKYTDRLLMASFQLKQNYPNPFNPETSITFDMPRAGYVSLKIYDNQGRLIETILDRNVAEGAHQYTWRASQYASGVYYYQLKSAQITQTKKMLLIK